MNFLSQKVITESKGALAEGALKKVSLCLKLGSQKNGDARMRPSPSKFWYARDNMITAAQLRAARGLLDWTRADLAKAANISPETVKNIEHGTFKPQENTAEAIVRAFGAHDVHFTENEGVQLRREALIQFEGIEGFKRFLDDVYQEAQTPAAAIGGNKPICAASVDDKNFPRLLGDFFVAHIQRMNTIENMKMHILHKEKPTTRTEEENRKGSYREYRFRSQDDTANVPFYVYGDKLAILMFEVDNPPHIVVIRSALVAKAYREQFNAMWKNAEPWEGNRQIKQG
jgi:DNA-binding XRE family transcriptional regulator